MEGRGLKAEDLFQPEWSIVNTVLEREGKKPELNGQLSKIEDLYNQLSELAGGVDATLTQHVAALKARTIKQLQNLEKKMQRAERKKHDDVCRQIAKLKEALFPRSGLQERVENFSGFYAKWGDAFIDGLYENSCSLEEQFVILNEIKAE